MLSVRKYLFVFFCMVFGILSAQLPQDIPLGVTDVFTAKDTLGNFSVILDFALDTLKDELCTKPEKWIDDDDMSETERTTYAKALLVPATSKTIIIGDLHGDESSIQSLCIEFLKKGIINERFVLSKDYNILALGDYTGRGYDSVVTLSVLLLLLVQNPKNVFLIKGNHETLAMAKSDKFLEEIVRKGQTQNLSTEKVKEIWNGVLTLFNRLPHNILIGVPLPGSATKFICFTHAAPVGKAGLNVEKSFVDFRPMLKKISKTTATYEPIYCKFSELPEHNLGNWSDHIAAIPKDFNSFFQHKDGFLLSARIQTLYNADSAPGRTIEKSHIQEYLISQSETNLYEIVSIFCGHEHLPGGIVKLRNYVAIDKISDKIKKFIKKNKNSINQKNDTDDQKKFIESVKAFIKKSWDPIAPNILNAVEPHSVYSFLTAPYLTHGEYNKVSYGILGLSPFSHLYLIHKAL